MRLQWGYGYAISLEDKLRSDDIVEEIEGVRVVANKNDADILRGSKIDYADSLQSRGFRIENPNVHAQACGCGGH